MANSSVDTKADAQKPSGLSNEEYEKVKRFARMSQLPETGVIKIAEANEERFRNVIQAYDTINGFEREILEEYDVPRHYSTVMMRKFHITGIYALCLLEEMGKKKEEIKTMKLANFIMNVERALREMGYYTERKDKEQ